MCSNEQSENAYSWMRSAVAVEIICLLMDALSCVEELFEIYLRKWR